MKSYNLYVDGVLVGVYESLNEAIKEGYTYPSTCQFEVFENEF